MAERNDAIPRTREVAMNNKITKVPKKRGRKQILPKMNNSERGKYYRNKRKNYALGLEYDIQAMKEQVARMTTLRAIRQELLLCPRATMSGSLVKIVHEYFEQFRHGVQLAPSRRNMLLPDVETCMKQQQLFMEATMVPDVGFGEFKGIDVVMDQWERYSRFHSFLQFDLLSVKVTNSASGCVIIETSGQLRTRYSRKTIENVFPHVVGEEELTQRVIGMDVVYPCRNQFYFTRCGRIERYDVEADFPEALQKAMGSLEDASMLLGQALIRHDHMMGELALDEMAIVDECAYVRSALYEDEVKYNSSGSSSPERMQVDYVLT